jgi:hypothetical protein
VVRREKVGTVRAGDYIFLDGKGNKDNKSGMVFFVHQKIVSERAEFVSNRMTYIVLRGRCCRTIILNEYGPSEKKTDDSKDSFYEE